MVIDKRLLVALAFGASAACTVHDTQAPAFSGPSGLALTLRVNANPDTINQDGGSQSSIRVSAIGPDGRGANGVALRIDISVQGAPLDYGTLSARTVVTGSDGTATVVFTAPPAPPNGVFLNNCNGLPGTCISIVAAATGTSLVNTNPESAMLRLVPTGVILPPATTPVACFTVSPSPLAANVPAQFTAGTLVGSGTSATCGAASSDLVSFAWNFGDGSSGTGRTVTHTFTSSSAFSVTLTETNDRGLSGSTTQSVTVGSASLPTPNFTFSPRSPAVNEAVFFNASASTAGAGHTISAYRWVFGDGASGSGQTVSHSYAAPGDYVVQLTVTDEAGQSSTSAGTTVTIGGQSTPGPTANFTFSPQAPIAGDTVVFDWRTSTTAQGQRIVGLDWNFGDDTPVVHCPGNPACTADGITTHVFLRTGAFAVNLVVTDSAGRTNTKSQTVTVTSGNPTAVLTVLKAGGLGVRADTSGSNAQGGAALTTYTFLWGDNAVDTITCAGSSPNCNPSAAHTYPSLGTYVVTLRVTDNANPPRSGSTTQTITVP